MMTTTTREFVSLPAPTTGSLRELEGAIQQATRACIEAQNARDLARQVGDKALLREAVACEAAATLALARLKVRRATHVADLLAPANEKQAQ